jgi:uncharacterized membrane protein
MVAQEIEAVADEQELEPTPHDVEVATREARVRAAERAMAHDVTVGMIVGIVVCVVVWVGIVVIALAGTSWDLLPVIGIAVAVGVLAGLFLGGAIGMTVAAEKLENAENPNHV